MKVRARRCTGMRALRRLAPSLLLFVATSAAAASLDDARPLFGAWRAADGSLVVVGRSDDALVVFDDASDRRRIASLRDDKRALLFADGQLALDGGDELVGRVGDRALRARRVPLATEEVRWSNGDVQLAGTLWRPATRARTPAIVLVHGSGPETRWAMRQFPAWLAAHGLTVIAYDKRARCQPWEAGIDVLAGDALGAVALLRARADVDPRRVGLLGISNGAFVVVHAAARASDVAFVVPVVGGAGALWRHELYRVHRAGEEAHLPPRDLGELDDVMRALYRPETFAADGGPRLGKLLERARGKAWLRLTPLEPFIAAPLDVALQAGRGAWANELSYDPAADLARLGRRPALFVLAADDDNVDTALCRAELAANAPNARVVVAARASHFLGLPGGGGDVVRLAPELFSSLASFLGGLR